MLSFSSVLELGAKNGKDWICGHFLLHVILFQFLTQMS